jgi:hypothetical protein
MERPEINLPTPMTPETRRAIQWICIDFRLFEYGNNDWGCAAWYTEKYPRFTDEQYRIFESYSNGRTAKQHHNMLKKLPQKERDRQDVFDRPTRQVQPQPPEFSCDRAIHKQIVPPLPCTPFFLTITGSAGSGKTSMLNNLLTSPHAYKKAFHAVHCIIPEHSVTSLKKNIFAKHPRMHDELNFATLDRIYEQVMLRDGEEKMSSLLIMDDVTASLKNLDVHILLNRRHNIAR